MVQERDDRIRAGFIGCGSHSFRNIYPTFQFAAVNLVATCDLVPEKAAAYAEQFGAERSYADYREMLEKELLEVRGTGAGVVVDHGISQTYYRPGRPGAHSLGTGVLAGAALQ